MRAIFRPIFVRRFNMLDAVAIGIGWSIISSDDLWTGVAFIAFALALSCVLERWTGAVQ